MSISGLSSNITASSNSIDLYQTESRDIDLLVVEDVPDVNGVLVQQPMDLTGATVTFSVRDDVSSPTLLIGKDSTDSSKIEITLPMTSGEVVIHIVPGDTQHMEPGEYVFDIWVELSSGKRIPIVPPSEFLIKEAVTKLA